MNFEQPQLHDLKWSNKSSFLAETRHICARDMHLYCYNGNNVPLGRKLVRTQRHGAPKMAQGPVEFVMSHHRADKRAPIQSQSLFMLTRRKNPCFCSCYRTTQQIEGGGYFSTASRTTPSLSIKSSGAVSCSVNIGTAQLGNGPFTFLSFSV